MQVVAKRIHFDGFIVGDFAADDHLFYEQVVPLAKEGKVSVTYVFSGCRLSIYHKCRHNVHVNTAVSTHEVSTC